MKTSHMKKIIVIANIILIAFIVKGQSILDNVTEKRITGIDTVYINNNTCYIILNDDIYAFGISNEDDFKGYAYKNMLQIRSLTRNAHKTASVNITYGDSTYMQYKFLIIKYGEGYPESLMFNDYRDDYHKYRSSKVAMLEKQYIDDVEEKNMYLQEIKTRAKIVADMSDEIEYGITENQLELSLRLIRIDGDYAYMKYEFNNKTALEYSFEKVSFQYQEKYKQGLLRKKKLKYLDVFPIIKADLLRVRAYENKQVVYVVPIYGIEEKEGLLVTFRERQGGRNMSIYIESEVITGSKLLRKN